MLRTVKGAPVEREAELPWKEKWLGRFMDMCGRAGPLARCQELLSGWAAHSSPRVRRASRALRAAGIGSPVFALHCAIGVHMDTRVDEAALLALADA